MHIARQTPQELVVVAGTRWISAICGAAALLTLYFAIARHERDGLFLVVLFLLFALIMDLYKTFTFDAMRRVVRWRGHKLFKVEAGEIPFDEITDIGIESTRASAPPGNTDTPIYRLTIITSRATIPMSYAYCGQTDRFSSLRGQILDFIKRVSLPASSK
jgi:hypothetical protein